jgi:probable phosphoglycerate mutase
MSQAEPKSYPQQRYSRPQTATEIILVRHGASAALVDGQEFPMLDGQGNPGLAPNGRQQAELVGERLASEPIDAIYVSSMVRTHETAAPLVARINIAPVEERDLREVHLGDWEAGELRRRSAEGHPIALRMHEEERWDVIPNAEPSEAFSARTVGSIERIVLRHPNQTVAVFCHGGVIGAICAHATNSRPFAFGGADNGSVSQLVIDGPSWNLRRYNDSSHLYDSLSTSIDHMT